MAWERRSNRQAASRLNLARDRHLEVSEVSMIWLWAPRKLMRTRTGVARGDARRRAMGEAMAPARVRPTRALRATAGPRRPASTRAAPRRPGASVPGFQFARLPPAPALPPAEVAAGARNWKSGVL